MATKTNQLNPLEQCKQYILSKDSFVLQGGAGSGKTETLKELLHFIKKNSPNARVICITHTNVAADEIASRVGENIVICTIHSFLSNLVKVYKKNIKSVISNIFTLKEMVREPQPDKISETEYKKIEHEKYKKIHEKFTGKLYDIKGENFSKPIGKREYDKEPDVYNNLLNLKIKELNADIINYIEQCDYTKIKYNETKFNSYSDLSYGHDGLLDIFHLLFEKYPILRKMIVDKFDYLFIDEYQDTNFDVITDLISLSENKKFIVGLFGDSMQAIYSDGVGDVKNFIHCGHLHDIPKLDNFRCSYEVLQLINPLRLDGIEQNVAFKMLSDGRIETEEHRHGNTTVLYSVCKEKPTAFSSIEEKKQYQEYIDELLVHAESLVDDYKILLLTNKSISQKNNFEHLYKVFDNRFSDVSDRVENYLKRIQVLDVCDICYLYTNKNYNPLIKQIRNGGYLIRAVQDKHTLKSHVEHLINNEDLSLWQAVEYAKKHKLIKQTETCVKTIKRNEEFLKQLKKDELYQQFKKHYYSGKNTFSRITDVLPLRSKEEFEHLEYQLKNEMFINTIFSENIKFSQALNYIKYLNEETQYITMHKTKGSSIPSVIVVMEEFFWNEYDFSLMYSEHDESKTKKRLNSQKLIYVACSRARKSVVCMKIIKSDEIDNFKKLFPNARCFKDYTKENY